MGCRPGRSGPPWGRGRPPRGWTRRRARRRLRSRTAGRRASAWMGRRSQSWRRSGRAWRRWTTAGGRRAEPRGRTNVVVMSYSGPGPAHLPAGRDVAAAGGIREALATPPPRRRCWTASGDHWTASAGTVGRPQGTMEAEDERGTAEDGHWGVCTRPGAVGKESLHVPLTAPRGDSSA